MRIILQELEGCGYDVSYRVIDAADYGVPQHRKRLYIVGILRSLRPIHRRREQKQQQSIDHHSIDGDDNYSRQRRKYDVVGDNNEEYFDIARVCFEPHRRPPVPLLAILETLDANSPPSPFPTGTTRNDRQPSTAPSRDHHPTNDHSQPLTIDMPLLSAHRLTPSQWRAVCHSSTFRRAQGAGRIADVSRPARTLISSYKSHHIMYSSYIPLRPHSHSLSAGPTSETKSDADNEHDNSCQYNEMEAGTALVETEERYDVAMLRIQRSAAVIYSSEVGGPPCNAPVVDEGEKKVEADNSEGGDETEKEEESEEVESRNKQVQCTTKTLDGAVGGREGEDGGVGIKEGDVPVRFYTVRECARMMGFPESYILSLPAGYLGRWQRRPLPPSAAYRMLGNAVVPPIVRMIAQTMLPSIIDDPTIPNTP